jgi:hypothetical protein
MTPGMHIGRGILKRNALLAVAISALLCGAAFAQDDGERPPPSSNPASDEPIFMAGQLKDTCQPAANLDAAAKAAAGKLCDSYLRGLADGLFMVGALDANHIGVCLPNDGPLAVEDAKAAFLKYAAEHPDLLDQSAGLVGAFALVAASPCQNDLMSGGERGQE